VDTATDVIANIIPLEGEVSSDPTPDLVAVSPNGSHAFLSLRGAEPADRRSARQHRHTPGVGILKVLEGGRSALFESVAPVSTTDAGGVERADVHAMTLRILK